MNIKVHVNPQQWIKQSNVYTSKNSTGYNDAQIITQTPTGITIQADAVASTPVLYAVHNNTIYVTDTMNWMLTHVPNHINTDVLEAYFSLKNTLDNTTIIQGVYQIVAGETLHITTTGKITRTPRIPFRTQEPTNDDYHSYYTRFKKLLKQEFSQAFAQVQGNIVIPLSGGYDSRIIATLAVEFGYRDRVIAFSYGPKNNPEAQYAKTIAQQLNIQFEFIEYTEASIRKVTRTPAFDEYIEYSSQSSTTPHAQDYYAIQQLLTKKIITPEDTVFAGHSGDFTAGSRLEKIQKIASYDPVETAMLYHAIRPPSIRVRKQVEHILRNLKGTDACEFFDMQERQAKYIVNSVRTYEFFGLSWSLPLFSDSHVQFWNTVPNMYRMRQKLYNQVVQEHFKTQNIDEGQVSAMNSSIRKVLKRIAARLPSKLLLAIVRTQLRRSKPHQERTHPLLVLYPHTGFRRKASMKQYKKYGFGTPGRDSSAPFTDYAFYRLVQRLT